MSRLKSLAIELFGDTDSISSEKYFVSITCFVSAIFLVILCVFHLLMGFTVKPVILAGGSSIVMSGMYYLVHFKGNVFIPKLVLTVFGLVMLDLTWYAKFLSYGPVLFYILMFGALVLWVWDGKALVVILLSYFFNIWVLFYIDYHAPADILHYADHFTRSTDIYLNLFFYALLLIFLLYVVKVEFHKQRQRAVKSDQLKSAFLANMSHEIRTPMNGILGFLEILKEQQLSSDLRREYIEVIEKSGRRMLNIINDIIDISKIESGLMKVQMGDTHIHEHLDFIYTFFKPEAAGKGLDLKLTNNIPPDKNIIRTDKEKVYAILANLVKNAIKYTNEGFIHIGCDYIQATNSFKCYVADSGIGIPQEKQTDIFKHFVQADITNIMAHQGAGIGLAITKAYVNLLGGDIEVESEIGKGSVFSFTIPYHYNPPAFIVHDQVALYVKN